MLSLIRLFTTIGAVNKHTKSQEKVAIQSFYNVSRLSDVLPNFLLTTSETMCHYYL